MNRVMIDTTHDGLPAALNRIRSLAPGNLVALYDTGSPDIAATPADLAEIPSSLHTVLIDQGFTGSPNLKARIRDCENGAWTLANAVNKTGWDVARPMLYLGFPDTAIEAYNAGWRGDVWLVQSSGTAPVNPPVVPKGLNVVAVQWNFQNTEWDESVVFDASWPNVATAPPDPPAVLLGYVSFIQENFKATWTDFVVNKVQSTDGGNTWTKV
jgi:hypothetical protein